MSNISGNQELNTNVNNVSGINKIQNSILPQHNHNITTSINSSFVKNALNISANRANETKQNTNITEDGNQSALNNQFLPAHSHDIQYNGTNNINVSESNISFELTMNQIAQIKKTLPAYNRSLHNFYRRL